jgi:hypothetical protein
MSGVFELGAFPVRIGEHLFEQIRDARGLVFEQT